MFNNIFKGIIVILLVAMALPISAQLSGSLESNVNFYQRDTTLESIAGNKLYENQLSGGEAWLNVNYNNYGFDIGVRFDMFMNSNLQNPNGAYSAKGIGRWYVRKSIDKLDVYAGYIYDQIGSGIIYRSYEARPLFVDNALFGAQVAYNFTPDWQLKGFMGQQKQQFESYDPILTGLSLDGFFMFGDEASPVSLAPGFGVVNRKYDDASMNKIVNVLNTYTVDDVFDPNYNTYAASVYNTLSVGNFTWYTEAAFKTEDTFLDPILNKYIEREGLVFYNTMSYTLGKVSLGAEYKYTENFQYRMGPEIDLNRPNQGTIAFLPPMARQNTYRLNSRYQPATQEIGEQAFQIDLQYSPSRKLNFLLNVSNIQDLNGGVLYEEYFFKTQYKFKRKWQLTAGAQYQNYNIEIYQFKPDAPMVEAITPFAEFLYKFSRKKSLRIEAQYMDTEQDFGSFAFLLAEYSVAPNWIFTVSDMYNNRPTEGRDKKHYPTVQATYSHHSTRISLGYIKQVEGVVCTGGICRVEPAFSGVRLSLNTTF